MTTFSQNDAEMMFRRSLDALRNNNIEGWLMMWAEDGIMEFPFAPPGYPRLVGKQAIRDYIARLPNIVRFDCFPSIQFHHIDGGKGMIVEFTAQGQALKSERPYVQSYVSVIEFLDGRVRQYRDYWNPDAVRAAIGPPDLTTLALSQEATR